MHWRKFGLAVLAAPAMLVIVAVANPLTTSAATTTSSSTTTSSVTQTVVTDPACAFTPSACVSASPSSAADPAPTANAGVQGASTGPSVPSTGAGTTVLAGLVALVLAGFGIAAIRWARSRH